MKILNGIITTLNRLLVPMNAGFYRYSRYLPFKLKSNYMASDFIRISTLELIAKEIEENCTNPNYCVAELGVYRGGFAKYINYFFSNRKLYLFDTFEGFNLQDMKKDIDGKLSNAKQDFSKTNIEMVLNNMKQRNMCIIKKGFFPETVKKLEEIFCFVSIDADLFQPIYEGLVYFILGYVMVGILWYMILIM